MSLGVEVFSQETFLAALDKQGKIWNNFFTLMKRKLSKKETPVGVNSTK